MRVSLALLVVALLEPPVPVVAQALPPPLSPEQIEEVKAALDSMKGDQRGPYLRVRWFCADGSVLAPEPYACQDRGGGAMYAEYNERARRLAALHFHIGTVLQATPKDSLFDAAWANHWLKELVVQQFLLEVDDGWALRQARYYRGAKQIEDEEQRGRELLQWLLADRTWTARNYLLALRLAAVVPHPGPGGDRTSERIRNLASELGDLDRRLQPMRVKIHSFPSREDVDSVEALLERSGPESPNRAKLVELRDALRTQYDPRHAVELLGWHRQRLPAAMSADLTGLEESLREGSARETLSRIAVLGPRVRRMILEGADGRRNLRLVDLQRTLLELAFLKAQEAEKGWEGGAARLSYLLAADELLSLSHAAGFLSEREHAALSTEIARLRDVDTVTAGDYRRAIAYLGRSLDWAMGTVRGVFGTVVDRYAPVAPKVQGFADAALRGSVLLPLSRALGRLAADADGVLGATHVLLDQQVSHGVRGLNPGVALRPLTVVEPDALETHFDQGRIYVLPATTPELRPVAGVITLDEGNLLSHVQLLARNLGIPNAAVLPEHLPLLRRAAGREVFYAVTPLGRVILKTPEQLTTQERALVQQSTQVAAEKLRLDTRRLRLDRAEPIPLAELRADASGVWVGPKAANLGQLAAYFPGRVSAGVALPFGMFYRHVNRPLQGAPMTVLEELDGAYREAEAMRAAGRPESAIDEFMFAALARVRQSIMELPWLPEMRTSIESAIRETFGDKVERGVFVRSDTNVEDLPQFSGAGLNLTVPHQITLDAVLASIRRVWTSPFSERAYLWRKQILEEQSRIYPSVLLLESVHSEKSGVLITSGLGEGSPDDLTIAVAEGVGGAVEGEDAETIVVRPDGTLRLLSQAKAPARRVLVGTGAGGVKAVAAERPEYLLTDRDIAQLRAVVQEWETRFAAPGVTVWDIEFGFVQDQLWLFQIRPFVRFRSSALLERLRTLDADVERNANRRISLREGM